MTAATPRFRQDLVAETVDVEGVACVDVRDPVTGGSFRFYDYEYAMAQQLNGQPADAVVSWASAAYGMEIGADAVAAFASQLAELGFLEAAGAAAGARADVSDPEAGNPTPPPSRAAAQEPEQESAPVSQVVNHLMTALPAAPSSYPGAYPDRDLASGDADSGEVAESEWSRMEGARTATAAPDSDLLAASESFGAGIPTTAPDMVAPVLDEATPAAVVIAPGDTSANSEFMEDDATGHWVPKMVRGPGGAGGGPEPHREKAQWAMDLSTTLQSGPHRASPAGGAPADGMRPHVNSSADHDVTVLADPSAPDPDATPPPQLGTMGTTGSTSTTLPGMSPPPPSFASPFLPSDQPPRRSTPPTPPVTPPAVAASLTSTDKLLRRRTPTPRVPPPSLPDRNGSALPAPPQTNGPGVGPVEPPPNLLRDRRQPPAADAVVMSPFQNGGGDPVQPKQFRVHEGDGVQRRSRGAVMAVLVLLGLTVGIGLYLWRQQVNRAEVKQVRVVTPKPTAVYRWFEGTGSVVGSEARVLTFGSSGRVTEVLPGGTNFSAGEIVARLQGAAAFALEVNRHRSRIGFYEQMRDSMSAAANQPEARQAEIKIGLKRDLLTEADKKLAGLVVRPSESGEIAEVFVQVGTQVRPETPVLRIKGGRLRGEFTLSARDWQTARRLAFCRVEVVGLAPRASNGAGRKPATTSAADSGSPEAQGSPKFVDCKVTVPPDNAAGAAVEDQRKFVVELPAGTAVAVGQPLRLARARYDAVFPIPRAAIVRVGDTDRVYVASRSGIAEPRAVTAVDAGGDEALVTQGLDIGDAVIVAAPAGLRDGSRIHIER
jgi:hypothetical protein